MFSVYKPVASVVSALVCMAIVFGLQGCGDTPAPPKKKLTGSDLVCIGPRAHRCDWKMDGDSPEKIENATLVMQPEPANNSHCATMLRAERLGVSGDMPFCVGANANNTCTGAKNKFDIIKNELECSDCFGGLTMDLYYSFDFKKFLPHDLSLGIKNAHIYGDARVHPKVPNFKKSGKIPLIGMTPRTFKFPAGIIPFTISLSFPTSLSYDFEENMAPNFTAGVYFEHNFGDHYINWTKGSNFTYVSQKQKPTTHLTPTISGLDAETEMKIGLESTLVVEVEKMVSFNLTASTDVSTKITLADKNLCADGEGKLQAQHQESVHFTLMGKDRTLYKNGPKEIFDVKTDPFHKCIPLAASTITSQQHDGPAIVV